MTHDAAPGPLTHCQITGSTDLFEVIDLGHQPLCDSLPASRDEPETTYPLKLMMCPTSGLAQLSYVVDGATVYHPGYPYRSGISAPLRDYQRAFAAGVVEELGLKPGSLVVDIGSNDGTLLTGFRDHGMRVFGVEPTDIANVAYAVNDVISIKQFFAPQTAQQIIEINGDKASLITATNVFAHMADLGEVMRGIDALLAPNGVFITESHYLLDVLEKNQFDTIYHEHIRTYSLKSLCVLFEQYGMEVFDVRRADRYGGNIRAYVCRRGARLVSDRVGDLLALELESGLFLPETWRAFAERVKKQRNEMRWWLDHSQDKRIAGKSCPGRASTLINYFGITRDQIPYLAELPDSLKLGRYLPGAHIPIVDEARLFEEHPDYLVLFSWHYADAIMKRLRERGLRSKFVMPLPEFKIID